MDESYRTQLAPNIQGLVDRLERFAGMPIGVAVDDREVSPTDPNPDRLAASITARSATILLREATIFPPQSVLHELLHVERFWLEAVPQIIPLEGADESNWGVTGAIENALEHLVIVPREAQYGFEPYSYWNETVKKLWSRYPWPEVTDSWARRKNCLLGSLSAYRLTSDAEVVVLVERALEQEGMLKEARRFVRRITDVLHSKDKMLRLTLQFVGIERSDVRLIRLDAPNRRTLQLPF